MNKPLSHDPKDRRFDKAEIKAFGLRIFDSQTVPEYLLEFLLVFLSQKYYDKLYEPAEFPDIKKVNDDNIDYVLQYSPSPRIGLKRFIFFERSKQENRFWIDGEAYRLILNELRESIIFFDSVTIKKDDVLNIIQDLFYGFNAVIKNRSWFAQALLPVCPEVIFCESIGSKKARNKSDEIDINNLKEVDGKFDFTKHDFMARGGEVYFLHLMSGLSDEPDLKQRIINGLNKLVLQYDEFSLLADWIQKTWLNSFEDEEEPVISKNCGWIPDGYARRAKLSCKELVNLLESQIPTLKKIEILSIGIVFQILRMMNEQASILSKGNNHPAWVIDVERKNPAIRKRSMESLNEVEEDFMQALYLSIDENQEIKEKQDSLNKASRQGHKLFRKLAKEIGLVIPPKGGYMRFSLNEDLVKFLVLSIIQPGKKIQLTTFLEKLWEHFGIIIGANEFMKYKKNDISTEDSVYFDYNKNEFQSLLKKCGFLRALSDATSIVENPFGGDK